MPNHCWNQLEVVGEDLTAIRPFIKTEKTTYGTTEHNLDFQAIVPMPPEMEKGDKWYDWRIGNWGTKWNSYSGQDTEDAISFDTAWAPPIPIVVALAKLVGKTLRLVYNEPGMDFCGEVVARPDGKFMDNCFSPRADAPDDLRDELFIDQEEGEIA